MKPVIINKDYRNAFDLINDAIFIFDIDTARILGVNLAMCEMYGYTRDEALSLGLADFFPEKFPGAAKDAVMWSARTALGEPQTFEYQNKDKFGRLFWVEVSLNNVLMGDAECILALVRNIDKYKRLEAKVNSFKQTVNIIDNINDGFFSMDNEWRIIYANKISGLILGGNGDLLLGKTVWEAAPWVTGTSLLFNALQRAMSEREQVDFEEYHQPTGRWMAGRIYPFEGGLSVCIHDITPQKQAEEALYASELKYKELVESLPESVFEIDLEGRLLYANPVAFQRFGYNQEDFKNGLNVLNMIKPGDRAKVLKNMSDILDGRMTGGNEYTAIKKCGVEFPVVIHSSRILEKEKPVGFRGFILDNTSRKQVEEILVAERQRLYSVLDKLPAVIYLQAPDYTVPFANKYMKERYGNFEGKYCYEVFHKLKQPCENCRVFKVFKTNKSQKWEGTWPDGKTYEIHDYPFSDIDGTPLVLEFGIDITERKNAEAYFQQLFENSPQGIVMIDNKIGIIKVNRAFERLFQYAGDELYGKELVNLIVPEQYFQEHMSHLADVSEGKVFQTETVRRRRDGGLVDVSVVGYPIYINDQQVGSYIIFDDISKRKQSDKELKYLSLHDPLTELYNRTYFEQQMNLVQNTDKYVGILICDVDGLKLVNDCMGHDKGNTLLLAAAGILRKTFRAGDVIARIGGDEFAVLLSGCDEHTMDKACARIKDAITRHNSLNPSMTLSMSIGYAICYKRDKNMRELFKEADNNMYREKLHRSKSARSAVVQTLMKALEVRDFITEGHADRLQDLVANLGLAIGLPEHTVNDLRLLAQFHDIGKVGIPDRILFKPSELTPEELQEMQRHCEIGHRIALASPDLVPIADWILKHHEWWNGKGYPLGLTGGEIPLACRILAIADAYDAMTSDRPYRNAMPRDKAMEELIKFSGIQFDPLLVERFLRTVK